MRCAGAILLIAIVICFTNQATSSPKVKELYKTSNKLHELKKTNCKYVKCPDKVDRACVRVRNKNIHSTKTVYISVVNKCEIDYIKCHEGLEATRVPLEKCSHKRSLHNPNTTKKRIKRSPHIAIKTLKNQVGKQARKIAKPPYRNKYNSFYFGPKRKAVYLEPDISRNDDDENSGNIESDHNYDRNMKDYMDDVEDDRFVDDDRLVFREIDDVKTDTGERLVGEDDNDRGSGDKQFILFNVNTSKENVYELAVEKGSGDERPKSNEDANISEKDFNDNENEKDLKATEADDEQALDNFSDKDGSDKDVPNDEKEDEPADEDRSIIVTVDRNVKIDENDIENDDVQDTIELDNGGDNGDGEDQDQQSQDQESQQDYIDEIDSNSPFFNIEFKNLENRVDKVKSINSENDNKDNEGPKDTQNVDEEETPAKQNETILININYKPKDDGNVSKALDKSADVKMNDPGKEKSASEKKVTKSDTSTEEDKKDVVINDEKKPRDVSKPKKQTEDNYDDVDNDQYSKRCPDACPARDLMVCARCKDGVYRTFMSACHLRMFNCRHPEEKLELVSRKPCILSAPFLNGMKTKGKVAGPGDDDKVLRYIRCKEKGDSNDPKCNFRRRARKRRISG